MKIGILGTRGIPNYYGGFEQFAQHLSQRLVALGEDVWVYNSHTYSYKAKQWNGVNIIHCYDPEDRIGTPGQFIYDFNCIRDSRKRNFDIILQLGYTSNSIWFKLLPRKTGIVTNMNGLEGKRSKYSRPVRKFLKYAEKLAVNSSHRLIADSPAIQDYLWKTYNVSAEFISYGAEIFENPDPDCLKPFGVEPRKYFMLIARMQPDNNIEEVIKGVLESESEIPLVVVGNNENSFAKQLILKYSGNDKIIFTGGLYDKNILDQLRYHCLCYFHGHSAGGTNPSLLEAMAASAFICAHDNPFNRDVVDANGIYFKTSQDVVRIINNRHFDKNRSLFSSRNLHKIEKSHGWNQICEAYHKVFVNLRKIM